MWSTFTIPSLAPPPPIAGGAWEEKPSRRFGLKNPLNPGESVHSSWDILKTRGARRAEPAGQV